MKLNGYARAALQTPEVRDVLKTFGSEAVGSTPDEFGPAFAAEVDLYKKVVAGLNLPPHD